MKQRFKVDKVYLLGLCNLKHQDFGIFAKFIDGLESGTQITLEGEPLPPTNKTSECICEGKMKGDVHHTRDRCFRDAHVAPKTSGECCGECKSNVNPRGYISVCERPSCDCHSVTEKKCTHSQHPSGAMFCGYHCTYPGAPRKNPCDCGQCVTAKEGEKEDLIQDIIDRLGNKVLEDCIKYIKGKCTEQEMRLALDIHGAIAHKDISAMVRPTSTQKIEELEHNFSKYGLTKTVTAKLNEIIRHLNTKGY